MFPRLKKAKTHAKTDAKTAAVNFFVIFLFIAHLHFNLRKLHFVHIYLQDLATQYHERFCIGSKNLDELCFQNEKWYTQVIYCNINACDDCLINSRDPHDVKRDGRFKA